MKPIHILCALCLVAGFSFSQEKESLQAAEAGDLSAIMQLAEHYGQPQHYDESKMLRYYTQAARAGERKAQAMLGYLYLYGQQIPLNPAAAVQWLELAAERGDVESQLLLGSHYLTGKRGIQQDFEQSYYYFQLAAKAGDKEGQLMMGIQHLRGLGLEESGEKALPHINAAAEKGHPLALSLRAQFYREGKHVKANEGKARRDDLAAVMLGEQASSLYELAEAARRESPDDPELDRVTRRLYERAAAQGHAAAIYELAFCYYLGKGGEQDDLYAAQLMADAAGLGYEPARWMLVYFLATGTGFEPDLGAEQYWTKEKREPAR